MLDRCQHTIELLTRGNTKADDEAYELIMKDKERLLDAAEPLRFIFSHSALREGWDNPNVFQICTLNETKSEIKKRQEIGRGLRLPVREDGKSLDDLVAKSDFQEATTRCRERALLLREFREACELPTIREAIKGLVSFAYQREKGKQKCCLSFRKNRNFRFTSSRTCWTI